MSVFGYFRDPAWWKQYAIYLVIALPLIVAGFAFVHGWLRWLIAFAVIVAASCVKEPIQRRVWR